LGLIIKGKSDFAISRLVQFAEYFNVSLERIINLQQTKAFNINNHNNENCTINNPDTINTESLSEAQINNLGRSLYNAIQQVVENR
jgi:hypothetical protein